MSDQLYNDPFDSASNPQVPTFTTFGQVFLDVWYCGLEKGPGKVPYDPSRHPKRFTAVKIDIVPLPEHNMTFPMLREMIAESKEYRDIVWASLRDLGVTNLREVNGRYAEVQTVPTGRTYQNDQGETRDATTFQFLQLFNSETECRLAYNGGGAPAPAVDQPAVQAPLPTVETTPETSGEKAIAEKFMKVVVSNAAHGQIDPRVVMETIKANVAPNPLLTKYYGDVNSPEVLEMITAAMTA